VVDLQVKSSFFGKWCYSLCTLRIKSVVSIGMIPFAVD
jgi:hypothetical protein